MVQAQTEESTFRMQIAVEIDIAAPPARIWGLLTDAQDAPRWNSTLTSIEGEIALGQKIAIRVPISERVFHVKVTELAAEQRMVFQDGFAPMFEGRRTFSLEPQPDGRIRFRMVEVFRGLMLPMIKSQLPDFGPSFEGYARDLKAEAERVALRAA